MAIWDFCRQNLEENQNPLEARAGGEPLAHRAASVGPRPRKKLVGHEKKCGSSRKKRVTARNLYINRPKFVYKPTKICI